MSTTILRSERGLGGAHWEAWMRLAGDTTFNLIGGSGARPERTIADIALALALGDNDAHPQAQHAAQDAQTRLGRAVAHAIASQSLLAWPDVLQYGFGSARRALLRDRLCAGLVTVDEPRSRRYVYTALAASFCDVVAASLPRYKLGARVARMRWNHYRATYDVVRDHLQCVADEAAADAWKVR